MMRLLQEVDTDNLGLLKAPQLIKVLNKVCTSVSEKDQERFVRFLDKDKLGRINYTEFMGRISKSSRAHNPFKTIVSRIAFFLKQNNVEIAALLKRLAQSVENSKESAPDQWIIPCDGFTAFLKQKVEKKREIGELKRFTEMIDIDKDGYISEPDLGSCIKNLSNTAFFRNNGEALIKSTFNASTKAYPKASRVSKAKMDIVLEQIRAGMIEKQIAYRTAFDSFDTNKDNMVSYAEFAAGVKKIAPLSDPILEQIFAVMDHKQIGLISY
jgi:Ca2+-binding EF-hand superfamily protein